MRNAGYRILAALDKDEWAIRTLRLNHAELPTEHALAEDIRKPMLGSLPHGSRWALASDTEWTHCPSRSWRGAWCCSAAWLNRVVLCRARTLYPFLAAIVVILWLWQRQAFAMLVPRPGLTYGFFLTPQGAKARFWVFTCPLRVGLICLSLCFITALVSAWRAGTRSLLACVIPWWLTAFLIFALPSMYLDAQGNASVFI